MLARRWQKDEGMNDRYRARIGGLVSENGALPSEFLSYIGRGHQAWGNSAFDGEGSTDACRLACRDGYRHHPVG